MTCKWRDYMKIDVSAIPYTEADELHNIQLVRDCKYAELLHYNQKLIKYMATCMRKGLRVKVPSDEMQAFMETGFYLATKAYREGKFIDFVVFYMEQYVFYQVYTEYFLVALPVSKRIGIQKLYNEVLKYLDTNSGTNYYDAISTAAENINMPLDRAINLMASFMQLSVKEPDEYEFADEIEKMQKWVCNKKATLNILDAPLPFVLALMEAQMQRKENTYCKVPFKAICEKFFAIAIV